MSVSQECRGRDPLLRTAQENVHMHPPPGRGMPSVPGWGSALTWRGKSSRDCSHCGFLWEQRYMSLCSFPWTGSRALSRVRSSEKQFSRDVCGRPHFIHQLFPSFLLLRAVPREPKCRSRKPRPRHLPVEGAPACQPHQSQGKRTEESLEWRVAPSSLSPIALEQSIAGVPLPLSALVLAWAV